MNDLEKEFIPYQEAFELKELGFDEPCMCFYNLRKELKVYHNVDKDWHTLKHQVLKNSRITLPHTYTAPTYSQAFKWFRKKGYRFSVIIDSPLAEEESHYIEIWFEKQFLHESHYIYKKYEDAELDLLKKLIGYEKEKQQ
jgi:hypothetical protein